MAWQLPEARELLHRAAKLGRTGRSGHFGKSPRINSFAAPANRGAQDPSGGRFSPERSNFPTIQQFSAHFLAPTGGLLFVRAAIRLIVAKALVAAK